MTVGPDLQRGEDVCVRKMSRPSDDVIVISDAEEGELVDVEDPEDVEEGELPDDKDSNTPLDKDFSEKTIIKRLDAIRQSNRLSMRRRSIVPKYHMREVRYTKEYLGNRLRRGHLPTHIRTPQRRYRKIEDNSDSEMEFVRKKSKLTSLGVSPKSNCSSLKSRLSNMMKYSSDLPKSKTKKSYINKNKENRVEDVNDAKMSKKNVDIHDDVHPENIQKVTNDIVQNNDSSDEDLDNLRELALKSKTQRASKSLQDDFNVDIDVQKNNNDEPVSNVVEVDKEIEELRLVALKSAILKKASKRKKIKGDGGIRKEKRERKSISLAESVVPDQTTNVTAPNAVSFLPVTEHNTGNFMYDYSNMYSYLPFYYNVSNTTDINNVEDLSNHNKENDAIKPSEETDDEELLRSQLLLSLSNNKKVLPSHISPKSQDNSIENSESSLIVRLGGSDTESECEVTKNLTIMHRKLSDQSEFQKNLEVFLKGARQVVTEKDSVKFGGESITQMNTKPFKSKQVTNVCSEKLEYKLLLERKVNLEKIKLAHRKEELKKSVEFRKLNAYYLSQLRVPQKKYLTVSQLKDTVVKKDTRRILRPSLIVNRRVVPTIMNKAAMSRVEIGPKPLDQQFLRKKIANQIQSVKNMQNEKKVLQKKKEALNAQIRAATLSLQDTDNALNINQKSLDIALRQLNLLQKQHSIIQRRNVRSFPRKSIGSTSIVNSRLKECEPSLLPQKLLSLKKNSDNDTAKIAQPSLPQISTPKKLIVTNLSKEKRVDNGLQCIEKLIHVTTNEQQGPCNEERQICTSELNNVDVNRLENVKRVTVCDTVPNDNSYKASNFIEYATPLIGIKSNQSWEHDPQAILCPFDIGGSCKDTSCTYFHPKI